jgi:hypothetical protein
MNPAKILFLVAALAPVAVSAQVEHSRAQIYADPPPPVREDLDACLARQDSLADRKAFLDREKMNVDLDGDAIAAEGVRLAEALRTLDAGNGVAVAEYNTLSAAQNRRVQLHNRRVAELNSASSRFNTDAVDVTAYCNWRVSRLR